MSDETSTKISDADLAKSLQARKALIVHFSHHSTMSAKIVFPNDLLYAIQNSDPWPLSCCVVWPGHTMDLPGSVGIILNPSAPQVVSVRNNDSGSFTCADGQDVSSGVPLDPNSLNETFLPVGPYNEWRVAYGAPIVGIFVSDRTPLRAKQWVRVRVGERYEEHISAEQIFIPSIFDAFPDMSFYTFHAGAKRRLK